MWNILEGFLPKTDDWLYLLLESIENLSNNNGDSYYPKIAVLENKVYVVWNDSTLGEFEIFYRRSIDNGATFESTINLSNTDEKSWTPTITATKVNSVPSDTVSPNTHITKAADGNNAVLPLANPSAAATVSKKIIITFSGTDNIGIASFQCSLDGKHFASCTSSNTFNNLAFGTHAFKVRAVDTAGNTDPTPASFTWTVLTPAQGVLKLKSFVNGMQDVSSGSKASLNARLDGALKYLSDTSTYCLAIFKTIGITTFSRVWQDYGLTMIIWMQQKTVQAVIRTHLKL